ncbi:hypothetical protein BJB45_05265 [Halomonas huangheensis]|uniref:Uncharacterized protein n=1 Tax=Halomonas huangheensis TaxID=1178482 RepID=W1N4T5_9GAMM|nr:hypothetical protein BJB45_05265 [Halomonas huangheensis]
MGGSHTVILISLATPVTLVTPVILATLVAHFARCALANENAGYVLD